MSTIESTRSKLATAITALQEVQKELAKAALEQIAEGKSCGDILKFMPLLTSLLNKDSGTLYLLDRVLQRQSPNFAVGLVATPAKRAQSAVELDVLSALINMGCTRKAAAGAVIAAADEGLTEFDSLFRRAVEAVKR